MALLGGYHEITCHLELTKNEAPTLLMLSAKELRGRTYRLAEIGVP
jgi:hypothetical protein